MQAACGAPDSAVKLTISHTIERADSKFVEAVFDGWAGSSKADCRIGGAPRMNPQRLEVVIADTDGIFPARRDPCALDEFKKIDRSMPIVAETEQIGDR
jgi:hypothetical protein